MSNCKKVCEFESLLGNLPKTAQQAFANISADEIVFMARYGILNLYYKVGDEDYDLFTDLDDAGFIRYDLDFRNADFDDESGIAAMIRWLYNELYGQPKSYSPLRGYNGEKPTSWIPNHEYEEIPRIPTVAMKWALKAIAERLEMAEMAALFTTCTGRRKKEWDQVILEKKADSALTKLREDESFKEALQNIETDIEFCNTSAQY